MRNLLPLSVFPTSVVIGFEPRLSLSFIKRSFVEASFLCQMTGLEQVLASSLRCGLRKAEIPRTSCAVYRSRLKEAL